MSWLILQNDRQFPDMGKAGSVLCKIGCRKWNYHCGEVSRDKINTKYDGWLLILITDGYYVFLFTFGWIAKGREAYSHNYRHYVSQCPVSPLDWLPNFPHMRMAIWVDPGEGSSIFTCQVNRYELSLDLTVIPCVAIEVHDHYTTPSVLPALLVNNGGYHWVTGLHLTGDWTTLKSLVNSCCKNINQITPMQKLLWKIMLHLLVNKTGWGSKHHNNNKTDTGILPNS